MLLGELYQHKQQQSLQAYLGSQTNFLSEDRNISPKAQAAGEPDQSMASTQEASLFIAESPSNTAVNVEPKKAEKIQNTEADSLYEKQRQYYFGNVEEAATDAQDKNEGNNHFEGGDCKPVESLEALPPIEEEESQSGLLDGLDAPDSSLKAPVKPARANSITKDKPLDAIVELNYEASSDEHGEEVIEVIE